MPLNKSISMAMVISNRTKSDLDISEGNINLRLASMQKYIAIILLSKKLAFVYKT